MEKLFIGIKGHVICLDKETGQSIWTTKLKTLSNVTNVHFEGNALFAYAKGHLYCLDPDDGSVKWTNPLNGFGNGPCIIASENRASAAAIAHAEQQQNAAYPAAMMVATASASSD